ncbi:autotransporter outer membrane beta-barrel domain-containing protein [Sphingomonas gellani]|uniref:autotransporter outer membrane beta-barrel domain-containing protein n=1 Tax=Sphingomonas gellani TaxID=1166340 RepID=UPI000B860AB9|nr:autotransporter outer membrane beta-barrel domain-containing protein [Sphingomonas gellani]
MVPLALVVASPERAAAQVGAETAKVEEQPSASSAPATPPAPDWIATLSSGVLARDGDAVRPFVVAGLSRRMGRGYVRVAATGFRSVVRQVDAALPSDFVIGSVGAGGTFGRWFVDGYLSAGRQYYTGVTTPLGTRSAQVGSASSVYGAALSGGHFIKLSPRFYVTPNLAVQYGRSRALRSALTPAAPLDYETRERAWTGSATARVDRFFGSGNRHIVGVSLSRVQSSNGATVLSSGGMGGLPAEATDVADAWFIAGASGSFQIAPRLWIDASASTTTGSRTGDYRSVSLGARLGF